LTVVFVFIQAFFLQRHLGAASPEKPQAANERDTADVVRD